MLIACAVAAADFGPDLLLAAKKGQLAQVRGLLDQGVPAESRDKDGRTALMLAAEHGHAEVVSLLLAHGGRPESRDKEGLNAYGLALLESGGKGREQVLGLLPAPPHVNLELTGTLLPDNAYSSCFLNPRQLAELLREIKPEVVAIAALRDASIAEDMRFVGLAAADGDVILSLRVRPGAMCVQQQSTDNLRIEIDARLLRKGSDTPLWQKAYGGGLRGMKARIVTGAAQYPAVYEESIKSQAPAIFRDAVTALLKQ